MERKLQVYENEEFGRIRVLEIDHQPWFVGKDVSDALGYKNSRKAIKDHVDLDDVTNRYAVPDTLGRMQKAILVNESGLYSLILSSQLSGAKKFKKWVTGTILPSIRKHGAYLDPNVLDEVMNNQEFALNLFHRLQSEKNRNEVLLDQVKKLTSKAHYFDLVLQSSDTIPISIIAKDYGLSAVHFNHLLHFLKIQYKLNGTWILYQKHADKGYTISKTHYIGKDTTIVHTYWTQKGRQFIYDQLVCSGVFPINENEEDCL